MKLKSFIKCFTFWEKSISKKISTIFRQFFCFVFVLEKFSKKKLKKKLVNMLKIKKNAGFLLGALILGISTFKLFIRILVEINF